LNRIDTYTSDEVLPYPVAFIFLGLAYRDPNLVELIGLDPYIQFLGVVHDESVR
jgi:hypothetical protein